MRRLLKILFRVVLIGLVLVQFAPRATLNISNKKSLASIENVHNVPDSVLLILKTSCYDCHSNNTTYPWYSKIQPVSWWLNDHISEGKRELNFDEFGSYSIRRQFNKLKEANEQIEENEMPLQSYTLIHRNASINDAQKQTIIKWSNALIDSFKTVYPADSLNRKKR